MIAQIGNGPDCMTSPYQPVMREYPEKDTASADIDTFQPCTASGKIKAAEMENPGNNAGLQPPEARTIAALMLKRINRFNDWPESWQNRILDFYARHATADIDNPVLLYNLDILLRDDRFTPEVLIGLEQLEDPGFLLADGIQREELLLQVIRDIAAPQSIRQGGKSTCSATSVQIALAIKNPGRYIQIAGALASREGDASTIVPGLRRDEGTPIKDDDSGRSITTRILNPAFMEYGGFGDYDDRLDVQKLGPVTLGSGLNQLEKKRLYEGVLGEKASNYGAGWNRLIGPLRNRTFRNVKDALSEGKTVMASINVQDPDGTYAGGHAVVMRHMDSEYAYMVNPWGKLQKVPLEEIRRELTLATISSGKASAPPPSALQDPGNYMLAHIEFKK